MTDHTQPEALRLADELEDSLESHDGSSLTARCQGTADDAAAELRRLHALAAGQATAAQQPKQGVAYAAPEWIDRGYKTDVHGRPVPTVTVGFNPDDWDARDAFALRASHGQAPAQPAATVIKRGAGREWMSERLGHLPDGIYSLYLATPSPQAAQQAPDPGPPSATIQEAARHVGKWLNERPNRPLDLRDVAMLCAHAQQADSVQEDAARYRLVRRGQHWSVIDGIGNNLRAEALDAAIDAAMNAGKERP